MPGTARSWADVAVVSAIDSSRKDDCSTARLLRVKPATEGSRQNQGVWDQQQRVYGVFLGVGQGSACRFVDVNAGTGSRRHKGPAEVPLSARRAGQLGARLRRFFFAGV